MAWQHGGAQLAERVVSSRAGSGLDPGPTQAFLSLGRKAFAELDQPSVWEVTLATEPGEQPDVSDDRLDDCLAAVADFADLKSMWTVGHSRGVAALAAQAAAAASVPAPEARQLYHAALVHDIGRVTVPVRIWAKPGPLTRDEREQVRLHAYHSERVLDAAAALRPLARLAGSHGERGDGSGYHRGAATADLPLAAPGCSLPPTAITRCAKRGRTGRATSRGGGRRARPGRAGRQAARPRGQRRAPPRPGSRARRRCARLACRSASARCSRCWRAASPPSRSPASWGSRRKPAITTFRASTPRCGCPAAPPPRCSRWSTDWWVWTAPRPGSLLTESGGRPAG